ncbi:MAG TPA: FAD:protein FMN transferase [Gemmatimonadales bacterium]|nr:FAD:protein FMN transferase [Gemmatimonadales bacterium]
MLLTLVGLPPATPTPGAWVEREAYLMGTTLRVAVAAADRVGGIQAIEDVFAAVRRLELVLSTWRDDSEIAALNRARPGRPVRLSAELHGILAEAAEWSRATGGAFDPAIGPLVEAWGLRGPRRSPSETERSEALAASDLGHFELRPDGSSAIRRNARAWLDTGGFGKGAALREAGRLLRARGIDAARLNFGGQVLALGHDEAGAAWSVPVAHPTRRDEPAAHLRVANRSVSTSSQSQRAGHVLDPRSGAPVPAWGSVTVVAEDPLVADIVSTALLVMGPAEALDWAERRSDIGVLLLVERDGRVHRRWNRELERYLVADTTTTRGG